MAHEPLNLSIAEAGEETRTAWMRSYSPQRNEEVLRSLAGRPLDVRISHLVARLFFRGIYFPQMGKMAWIKLLFDNRRPIISLIRESLGEYRRYRRHVAGSAAPTS